MAVNGLYGNGPILKLSSPFLSLVKIYVSSPTQYRAIENSVYSIDHKLNIMRYNAGLLQEMDAGDFKRHRDNLFDTLELPRKVNYRGRFIFKVHDIDEYTLFLTFSLEAMTAAAFSLMDVCGSLLNEMYDLGFSTEQVDFVKVVDKLETRSQPIHSFLKLYRPYKDINDVRNEAIVSWIKPLKDIRNATTHQQITRICRYVEDTSLHHQPDIQELRLDRNFFDPPREVVLKLFAEECFNGLEDFVTELYEKLRQALEADRSIPLY